MPITRRDLIWRAAAVGGYGAALATMQAFGIAPAIATEALPRDASIGRGRRVIVLGAGIAGLVSAYELMQSGFDVTVLEARQRVGGRNWTLRNGDRVQHMSGPDQIVSFSEGQYFNAGPARLPSHHQTILGYCRELNVALEVEINASRNAYVVKSDGTRVRMSQVIGDTRGYISELLAHAAQRGALDTELSADERANLLAFLRYYGDLDESYAFNGTERSGYVTPPGAARDNAEHVAPFDRARLLSRQFTLPLVYDQAIDMQPTMFQPVGGMDQIPRAFGRALGTRVKLGCEVVSIRNQRDGVTVSWREDGRTRSDHAAYVVCALPAPILGRTSTNFTGAFTTAIRAVRLDAATKLAWQAPRFWERNDNIYGGLSYLDHDARLIWYPSTGLFSDEGVLVATYNTGDIARRFATLSIEERHAASRAAVEQTHPGQGASLRAPVSVVWRDQRFSEGPWSASPVDANYDRLCTPEGRVHLAGDWLAQVGAWQEGAALSGRRAVRMILARAREENAAPR